MIKHYAIVALRNLRKYKLQTIISVLGLAVGFVCFALSVLWIRYEMAYDNFHKNAKRIYRVVLEDKEKEHGLSSITPYPLIPYLKKTFPEVENATTVRCYEDNVKIDGRAYKLYNAMCDSSFITMFDIPILEGTRNFLNYKSNEIAITGEAAVRIFGEESPLGKQLEIFDSQYTITALVPSWSKHSNLPYDIIQIGYMYPHWNGRSSETYMLLKENTDAKKFAEKLHKHKIAEENTVLEPLVLIPLTSLHYILPSIPSKVKFNHILLFALAGILVILCSLFNYLTLFVYHIRIRIKELALRKVSGSSNAGLLYLLSMEVIFTFIAAILVGILLIECTLPEFRKLAGIISDTYMIYAEVVGYALFILLVALLFSFIPIYYFRKKTLSAYIQGGTVVRNKNIFRKLSIAAQLVISIGFIFCTIVLFRQIYMLRHVDIGMERKNIGCLRSRGNADDMNNLSNVISQVPCVKEVIVVKSGLLPEFSTLGWRAKNWEGKSPSVAYVDMQVIYASEQFRKFYNLRIVRGTSFTESSVPKKEVIINQTAAKALGLDDPVGKKINWGTGDETVIIGVMQDFYKASPTMPVKPVVLILNDSEKEEIVYKYQAGKKKECREELERVLKSKFPDSEVWFYDAEEESEKYIQSETSLLWLLGVVSCICILVSLFGIYSLASLTCEQRRKEIAVRKVNGAAISHILILFYKEYILLVVIASAIAFPIGYLIMKPWVEQYIKQITFNVEMFLGIFLLVMVVIFFCILAQVLKAARANPAEVIKSE